MARSAPAPKGARPGELPLGAAPFEGAAKGLKGKFGRSKLFVELYWGNTRKEVRAFAGGKPIIAAAEPSAPFPLWGFKLPGDDAPFTLARRTGRSTFHFTLLPRTEVEKRPAGARDFREVLVPGGHPLTLEEGETARFSQGDFTLVARVGRPLPTPRVNPLAGTPWLLVFLILALGGGFGKLISLAPKDSPDFQVQDVPAAVVRLLAPPPPEKKERAAKQLEKIKDRAPKKVASAEKKQEEKVPEVVQKLPKNVPTREVKAISALAKLTASPATQDVLAVSANPLATGKPNGKNKLAGLIGTGPGPSTGVLGLGLGTKGGGGTVGGGELLRGKGGIGGLAVGSVGKGGVGGTVTRASERAVAVQGSIDKAAVAAVINRNIHEVQSCYERALFKSPGLAGKVQVEWSIATTGQVASAKTKSSTLRNATAETCILKAIKGWQFPKARGGSVIITYPFVFNAVGF